jgi:hypothetical protein
VNHALDPHAIGEGMVENQILFELPHSPHAQRGEILRFTGCAEVPCLGELKEGAASRRKEALGRIQATIFT